MVLPLFAPAPVPSSVALQPGAVATRSMWLIVPVVTPVPALKLRAFSFQGSPCTVTVTVTVAIVQPVKDAVVIVPIPVPDRPLPFFSVPDSLIEVHLATVPVVASFTWPDPEKLKAPPGLTVQVALVAIAVLVPRQRARAAAPLLRSTAVRRLRM